MSRAGTSPLQDVLDVVRGLNTYSERTFLLQVEQDMEADEFKAWLAVQSDFAQSGFDPATGLLDAWLQGNQRITRQRLNDFVAAGGNEGTGRKDQAQSAKQKRKKGRI